MDKKCASSYANIFMRMIKEKYMYSVIEAVYKFNLQFIDDIFLIWTVTIDQLIKLKQQINEVHPSIKFAFSFFNKDIYFLDTFVYKKQ